MAFRQIEETLRTLLAKMGVLEKRSTPSGAILQYAASTAPTGWLLCDGTAVSRVDYADLFAVIGTTYGTGNGSTTFNLPNLKGRVPAGRDASQTEFTPLGKTGGAKTHTLSVAEMPSHTHVQTGQTIWRNIGFGQPLNGSSLGNAQDSGAYSTEASGGNAAHNNLPPYLVLNHIIKT